MTSISADTHAEPRTRIVEAAARLLRDEGLAGVTTRSVAQAAGVPAPTIFRIFADKDGLMDAVAEHVMSVYAASKARAHEAGGAHDGQLDDPVQDLREAWHRHIDFGLANPDLFVLLSAPGRRHASPATEAGLKVLEARVARVAAAGLLALPEARAVRLIHAAGTGAVFALLQHAPASRDLSLAGTMIDAVLGAVLTTTPAPPTSDLLALGIAFRRAVPDLSGLTGAERGLLTEWVDRAIGDHAQPTP